MAHHPAPFHLRAEGPEQGVYVRLGSTSRRADPEMLAELRRQAAGESFDLFARSGVTLANLDKTRLKAAFEGHDVPLRAAKLEALGILTKYQGKVVATNAGVILFGQDPIRRRYLRDARIEGARFAGSSRAADIEDIFDPEEELTVLEAVDAAERFIRRNTRQAEPIPKGRLQREPRPEYSSVMIRELLINAVAHTDYSKSGETIKAFVYDDRIEIHNPGPMLPGTTTDDIREGRSKIRNRGIAGVLRRIRYMERFGTAWEKISQEVDRGYPEPILDGDGPVFTATIWPHPSFTNASKGRQRGAAGPRSRKNREEDVIDFLRQHPHASAAEIASHLGVSSRQTRTYLKRLEEAQRVRGSEGPVQHPARTYRLSPGV